jgi:predicted NAD-dependent protein-ADP-ribosyltransferase YbiA (DUF1768 family)
MERCSYFIQNKALFGSYPTQDMVDTLEENGVRHFIDLTCPGERRIIPYETKYEYVRYSIRDHKVPSSWHSFAQFILWICNLIKKLKPGHLIYVHCKGGHGRSGIVVASVLCYLYRCGPAEALRLTGEYHSARKEMKEKRRRLGAPPGEYQKDFVRRFFRPLYFYKAHTRGLTAGLSNFSIHSVEIENFGTFPTAEAAFHAYKDPDNKTYVRKQELAFTPHISKRLGRSCKPPTDWDEKKDQIMYKILDLKFHQHESIFKNLLSTGLRPIIQHCPDM